MLNSMYQMILRRNSYKKIFECFEEWNEITIYSKTIDKFVVMVILKYHLLEDTLERRYFALKNR